MSLTPMLVKKELVDIFCMSDLTQDLELSGGNPTETLAMTRTVQYLSCVYNFLFVFSSGLSDVLAPTYSGGLDV